MRAIPPSHSLHFNRGSDARAFVEKLNGDVRSAEVDPACCTALEKMLAARVRAVAPALAARQFGLLEEPVMASPPEAKEVANDTEFVKLYDVHRYILVFPKQCFNQRRGALLARIDRQ